jgi:hypothetical protein
MKTSLNSRSFLATEQGVAQKGQLSQFRRSSWDCFVAEFTPRSGASRNDGALDYVLFTPLTN